MPSHQEGYGLARDQIGPVQAILETRFFAQGTKITQIRILPPAGGKGSAQRCSNHNSRRRLDPHQTVG